VLDLRDDALPGSLNPVDLIMQSGTDPAAIGRTSAAEMIERGANEKDNTLVDNAGVIQAFGARNLRMAQDLATIMGGMSAEQILGMKPEEQLLLIEGKLTRCKQVRHYSDALFTAAK